MMKKIAALGLSMALLAGPMFANEGAVPKGVPRLDHVFVIMMENHGYNQIIGNPDTPFAASYARSANSATNYFAVAHPSLTNYLEMVGGSNFGVQSDNNPDWHNATCTNNLSSGLVNTDTPASPNVCPIYGTGTDAATPAVDCTNEVTCAPGSNDGENNIDGVKSIPAAKSISGKTIVDQLVAAGLSWKTYQESLPASGADGVNFSDGFFTDASNITAVIPGEAQGLLKLYAAKHNPFVYFQSVQEGHRPELSLKRIAGFQGDDGLFEDLSSGHVPHFSFIAPNQCNDQHGRGNGGTQCDFDPNDNGTLVGLNPALMYLGDLALRNIVKAIHRSPVWQEGRNAIVVVWDEDDYSVAPTTNKVLLIVDTNYGPHGVKDGNFYTHFSLLKSLEGGFRLPCLNHACDDSTQVISSLFRGGDGDDR
ncbi:MAG TPA: alkaline phosphatase family protein [Candidatus Acidoferrum sp.]